MKTTLGGGISHFVAFILILFFISLLSCATTSTSVQSIEGSEFRENLPGMWEGKWSWGSYSGKENIKINNVEGNNVQLTGFLQGYGGAADTYEVSGYIENSNLILTWPVPDCEHIFSMSKDDSNELMLYGGGKCDQFSGARIQLNKIK